MRPLLDLGCREPFGRLPTMRWSPGTGLTLRSRWEPLLSGGSIVVLPGRATGVPLHSGPHRSQADNHGQCRSSLDLRSSLPSQVTILPDLAWRAGARLVQACIGLAVPGRPIGPWSRRTGAPQASATGRDGPPMLTRLLTARAATRRDMATQGGTTRGHPPRSKPGGGQERTVQHSAWAI
jgi:hypothetical protein